jgi:cytochrome c biogenesis protein
MGSIKGIIMNENEISADPLRTVWKFFATVRLTVVLLLTLALTSIIGTVVPQNEQPEAYIQAFGEFLYRFFNLLDIFDMYHSWWFQFLLLLLTLNVIVCSVDRLSATWKIIFVKNPIFNISNFKRLKYKEAFTDSRAPEQLKQIFEPAVTKGFRYSRTEGTGNGYVLFAEKWRWTRLGVYLVHTSVLLLLIGGLIGSIFGIEGFVNIPEGGTVRSIRLRNSNQFHSLGFEIRCDDFNVSFYDTGSPKEFRSSLTILEQGKPVLKKDIIVNDPLHYKGINFFQSSYGQLPPQAQDLDPPQEITIDFTSKQTGKIYKERIKIDKQVNIPEDLGKFVLKEFITSYNFKGRDLGQTFVGILTQNDGTNVEVILPLRFPTFDRMGPIFNKTRKDDVLISITEVQLPQKKSEPRYYTGLQVTKDPGVWVVYAGFILMIIGCFITFFMSHQRICVEITRHGKKSRVMVAGTSNKNKMNMQIKVKKFAKALDNLKA